MKRVLFGLLIVLAMVGTASADTISYTINIGDLALSGNPGPYATATVNLTDSTHATITFTSLISGSNINLLGDGGTAAVNVNATSWTIGSFTASNSGTGFTPGPLSDGGAGTENGFGSFNQTVNSFDGFTHSSNQISFILADTSGTWGSAANVLTANSSGYFVAAHIFVTSNPADASNGAIVTGFATNGTPTVPEPATLLLLGSGLLAIGAGIRRNRKN